MPSTFYILRDKDGKYLYWLEPYKSSSGEKIQIPVWDTLNGNSKVVLWKFNSITEMLNTIEQVEALRKEIDTLRFERIVL